MSHRTWMWALAAAMALAAGCVQNPVRPYQTMRSPTLATQEADLVVEGVVARSEDTESYPAGDISSNLFGRLGQECVVKTRVALEGRAGREGRRRRGRRQEPLVFWFNAPCFHAEPDVLLNVSLPPVLVEGARLRVYLDDRGGEYWLIAHERLPGSLEPPK